ncbi:MAG: hypothetical protein PHU46_01190 [Rhodocyclaceae bacterium]|nr:hypothetical protein [Rhodocyclaceae bacterium]
MNRIERFTYELTLEVRRVRQLLSEAIRDSAFWGGLALVVLFIGIAAFLIKQAIRYDSLIALFSRGLYLCSNLSDGQAAFMIIAGPIFFLLALLAVGEWINWSTSRHRRPMAKVIKKRHAFFYAGASVAVAIGIGIFMEIWC